MVDSQSSNLNLYQSMRHLLIGKSFCANENTEKAKDYLKQALRYNVANVEAFEKLLSSNILTKFESFIIKEIHY